MSECNGHVSKLAKDKLKYGHRTTHKPSSVATKRPSTDAARSLRSDRAPAKLGGGGYGGGYGGSRYRSGGYSRGRDGGGYGGGRRREGGEMEVEVPWWIPEWRLVVMDMVVVDTEVSGEWW
ncbi:hypothetical protein DY000_02008066 [Brassica cretica]|uniref:Uncharacterized protein n=1 Tax=Brassica cretica TaxID=69181 RepID=A0ABQ7C463_BRACR|nr:hypothetical protein DY000_02008066 [Brassica cretica]